MADVTMMEAAKYSQDTLQKVVAKIIVEASPVFEYLPIQSIQGAAYRYFREMSLGTVAFRGIGGSYSPNSGVINPQMEPLVILGGEVRLDNFEVQAMSNLIDLKASKYDMKARAMAITFSEAFFEGDSAVDFYSFDGLRKRLTGTQLISATTGGATLTLAYLDQLADAVAGGPDAYFMNKILRRKVSQLVRDQTGTARIDYTYGGRDMFNRQMEMYAGIPIRIIERTDDASTFMDFDEDDGQGNLDTASIYAVKFGSQFVHGIQNGSLPSVRDFGETQAGPYHLGRIEWYPGMAIEHPRSAARLRYINNA